VSSGRLQSGAIVERIVRKNDTAIFCEGGFASNLRCSVRCPALVSKVPQSSDGPVLSRSTTWYSRLAQCLRSWVSRSPPRHTTCLPSCHFSVQLSRSLWVFSLPYAAVSILGPIPYFAAISCYAVLSTSMVGPYAASVMAAVSPVSLTLIIPPHVM